MRFKKARRAAMWLALAAIGIGTAQAGAFQTPVEPFLIDPPGEPGNQPYEITPLLSVKDMLPRTGNRSQQVQMVTIPDGLGALSAKQDRKSSRNGGFVRGDDKGDFALFMNQEHAKTEDQQFVIGAPEYQGAIISLWQMAARHGRTQVKSGDLAYETVHDEETGRVHPPARAGNTADAFGRFCSGFMAHDYKQYGFDRPIYFTGEESGGTGSYDERGGIGVAVFEDRGERQMHTLPEFGRYNKENLVPVPGYDGYTVMMGLEDGPSGYRSQLYMYVARQDRKSRDPMKRNGLTGGKLYVLGVNGGSTEVDFESGERGGRWIDVTDLADEDDTTMDTESRARGAFDFFRVEDGDSRTKELVFDTTGGDSSQPYAATLAADQPGNFYGRLYDLQLNDRNPAGDPQRLVLEYDSDEAVSTSQRPNRFDGNALVSADNLTLSDDGYLMVQEDATGYGDDFMVDQGRDAQIWRFKLTRERGGRTGVDEASALPVAEVNCIWDGGRDPVCAGFETNPPGSGDPPEGPQGNGTWESSGIIDTDHVAGDGTFITDVQAHSELPPQPFEPDYGDPNEDGQLLLLTPRRR
jgi:hypothetical protein